MLLPLWATILLEVLKVLAPLLWQAWQEWRALPNTPVKAVYRDELIDLVKNHARTGDGPLREFIAKIRALRSQHVS